MDKLFKLKIMLIMQAQANNKKMAEVTFLLLLVEAFCQPYYKVKPMTISSNVISEV